ncbi:MAG: PDZ domain-containing protein [Planctomycetota bacterium]
MPARLATLFALVLGLALGFGLGATLPDRTAPTDATGDALAPRTSVDDRPSKDVHLQPVEPLAPPTSLAGAARDLELRALDASAGVGTRVRATIDASASLGKEEITGVVVDEEGRPLAGVTIVSSSSARSRASIVTGADTEKVGRAWSGRSLDDALERYARGVLMGWDQSRTAQAGVGGSFTLTGLEAGQHTLSAFLEDYTFQPVRTSTGSTVKLVGRRVGAFRLDVRLADGTAPETAVVAVERGQGRPELLCWSGPEHAIRVTGRSLTFRVFAGDVRAIGRNELSSDHVSQEVRLDLDRDGVGPHVVDLAPRNRLRVRVSAEEGGVTWMTRKWVKVVPVGPSAALQERALEAAEPLPSGPRGVFDATDLTPGEYLVAAGRGDDDTEVSATVVVREGIQEVELLLPALDASEFLVIRCTGPDGVPAKRVRFRGSITNGTYPRATSVRPARSDGGEYWVPRKDLAGEEPWTEASEVTLTATLENAGSVTVPIALGQESAEVQFEPACSIDVRVVGSDAGPYAVGASPLSSEDGGGAPAYFSRSQTIYADVRADGTAQIEGLQPGAVRVELKRKGKLLRLDPALASVDVTLTSGAHSVTITAPTLHGVTVHAPDLDLGTRIFLAAVGDTSAPAGLAGRRHGSLGEERRVAFADVPAGDYEVRAVLGDLERMRITVPCGEVEFVPDVVDAYAVVSLEPGKLGARAGLRRGDVVVELAGEPVDGNNFHQRLAVALESAAVPLTIENGGSTRTVTVERIEPGSSAYKQLGVGWEPRSRGR